MSMLLIYTCVLALLRLPRDGHLLHNAVSKSLAVDPKIPAMFGVCRNIVSLLHSSSVYRLKFLKAQKERKLPDHQLPNDVATRWGSKLKMLQIIKVQKIAIYTVFNGDKRYRHVAIGGEEAGVVESVLRGLEGFESLTDLLSGENQVTISSALSTFRHIHDLCSTTEEDDELSRKIKAAISDYLVTRLMDKSDTLLFMRVAEMLDPRYLDYSKPVAMELMEEENPSVDDFPLNLPLPSREETKKEVVRRGNAASGDCPPPAKKKTLADHLLSKKKRLVGQTNQTPMASVTISPEQKVMAELEFYLSLPTVHPSIDVLLW